MKSGIHQHLCPKCGLNKYCPQVTHCRKPDESICLACEYPDDTTKKRCMYCYQLYTPPTVPRVPSQACNDCYLIISAAVRQ